MNSAEEFFWLMKMAEKEKKGNRVEYSTFFNWKVDHIIGHEKLEEKGKTYVVKVWCKVCARHKGNTQLRGIAKTSGVAFIDGTKSVTKGQVIFI